MKVPRCRHKRAKPNWLHWCPDCGAYREAITDRWRHPAIRPIVTAMIERADSLDQWAAMHNNYTDIVSLRRLAADLRKKLRGQ